jgi:hypothetical protein
MGRTKLKNKKKLRRKVMDGMEREVINEMEGK